MAKSTARVVHKINFAPTTNWVWYGTLESDHQLCTDNLAIKLKWNIYGWLYRRATTSWRITLHLSLSCSSSSSFTLFLHSVVDHSTSDVSIRSHVKYLRLLLAFFLHVPYVRLQVKKASFMIIPFMRVHTEYTRKYIRVCISAVYRVSGPQD